MPSAALTNPALAGGAQVLAVQVALHVRPLLPHEEEQGCVSSVKPSEREKTVTLPGGTRRFTYDHVFEAGSERCSSDRLYEGCVRPLVDGCFQGLNATVLAYGQTGSGKTFTMGTTGEDRGVIPRVAEDIFDRIESLRAQEGAQNWETSVSFFEIYRENVFDLLADTDGLAVGGSHGKAPELSVREDSGRNVFVVGLTEIPIKDKASLLEELTRGGAQRATASTEMNSVSSRSHAIFTISLRNEDPETGMVRTSKFHLVDLAGSERAKRTKAQGDRLQEGITINRGLLALGNVISALGDDKRKPGGKVGHVPYRDSKLTRILQDSLGGNSRTVMVACISPADSNVEETLNTLKYANRARNIQNKPTVNDEAMNEQNSTLVAQLKRTIASLQEEVAFLRTGSERPLEAHRAKISTRETSQLLLRLSDRNMNLEAKLGRITDLLESIESSPSEEKDSESSAGSVDVHQNTKKNTTIDLDVLRRALADESTMNDDSLDGNGSGGNASAQPSQDDTDENSTENGDGENLSPDQLEEQHMERQVALQQELQVINDELTSKVEAMERMEKSGNEFVQMEASYAKAVREMCDELAILQNERDDLLAKLKDEQAKTRAAHTGANGSAPPMSAREKNLKQKLADLETKHQTLKKNQTEQDRLIRIKKRDVAGMDRLKQEIQGLKQSRVKLMRRIKEEGDEFRKWKQSKERELKQMKKQETKQRYKYMVLERQHERQQRVLQRKQEEASLAQKRLRDVLNKQKQAANLRNDVTGTGLGKSAEEMRTAFKEWLGDQLQVSKHLRSARKALRAEVETRKSLPIGDDPEITAQRRACTERIASLQASVLEAEEAAQTDRRWASVRSTHVAKQWLKILYQELISNSDKVDTLSEDNKELRNDNDDLQKMFLDLEHQHVLEKARLHREHEEKLVFMLRKQQASSAPPSTPTKTSGLPKANDDSEQIAEDSTEAVLLEKLDQLGADYDKLVALLEENTPSKSKAAAEVRKAAQRRAKEAKEAESDSEDDEDEEPLWLSSESESEDAELDSDDEDWTEDSPKKSRAARKRASGPSLDSHASKKSTGPSVEDVAAMRDSAEDQLPEDLVQRIDTFKVKELQDALFHIGLSVSGRKDVLRARLLCGLLDRQAQREGLKGDAGNHPLLPENVPSRHDASKPPSEASVSNDVPSDVDHVKKINESKTGDSITKSLSSLHQASAKSAAHSETSSTQSKKLPSDAQHSKKPASGLINKSTDQGGVRKPPVPSQFGRSDSKKNILPSRPNSGGSVSSKPTASSSTAPRAPLYPGKKSSVTHSSSAPSNHNITKTKEAGTRLGKSLLHKQRVEPRKPLNGGPSLSSRNVNSANSTKENSMEARLAQWRKHKTPADTAGRSPTSEEPTRKALGVIQPNQS